MMMITFFLWGKIVDVRSFIRSKELIKERKKVFDISESMFHSFSKSKQTVSTL